MTTGWTDIARLETDAALAREMELLEAVSHAPGQRFFWLWEGTQALVAPRKMAALPGFETASRAVSATGWPVHLRATGGDVTPQGPGIVNVTHVYSVDRARDFSIEGEYDRLCRPIEAALGPGASRGWMPGAFCDGAHNVQLDGRKFAGTAMRFRPARSDRGRMAVMAHALMLIEPPDAAAITALNRFLSGVEAPRRIAPEAHTGLGGDGADFLHRLVEGFKSIEIGGVLQRAP